MTEPSKTEQELRKKVDETVSGYFNQGFFDKPLWDKVVNKLVVVFKEAGYKSPEELAELEAELELWQKEALDKVGRVQELLAELAHARDGYIKLGEFDMVVKKPPTGLPQVGQFTPEEYVPILGYIPPEPWELTGFDGRLYWNKQGRRTILEDIQRTRKAKADRAALSPEERARLEREQQERENEE